MTESLFWLVYAVSGALAFCGVYYWRWRVALAILAGCLVTAIGWLLIFRFTDEEKRPTWLKVDLSLNLSLGLIFAAVGAGVAWWLLSRRDGAA